MEYARIINPKFTPQSEPIGDQIQNNAGGYVYKVDEFEQLKRFIILGSEGGTYYSSEREFTKENTKGVQKCLTRDHKKTLEILGDIIENRRAAKVDSGLFVLALACAHDDEMVRSAALAMVPVYINTASHLFRFISYVTEMRGWGRGLRKAVSNWYASRSARDLTYQALKYRNRYGWTHKDVLRMAHINPEKMDLYQAQKDVLEWIISDEELVLRENALISANRTLRNHRDLFHEITTSGTNSEFIDVILEQLDSGLTWEMVPRELLSEKHPLSPQIWEKLVRENMPMHALTRHLGMLTSRGYIKPLSGLGSFIADKLSDKEVVSKSGIHPYQALLAQKVYQGGQGMKGSLTWNPSPEIVDALEETFMHSFENVESSNNKVLLGIDVSGSMTYGKYNGIISCAEAAAAMAMVHLRTEKEVYAFGFADSFRDLGLTKKSTLSEIQRLIGAQVFGRTDCALPMLHAIEHELEVDAFVIYTDNETWYGRVHPQVAIEEYRRRFNPNAKLVIVAIEPNEFSIANPHDPLAMDVVGMDTATPQVISNFIRS